MNRLNLTVRDIRLEIAFDGNSLHIYNAFLVKDELKALGYRWNPADKSWYIRTGDSQGQLETLRLNLAKGGSADGGEKTAPVNGALFKKAKPTVLEGKSGQWDRFTGIDVPGGAEAGEEISMPETPDGYPGSGYSLAATPALEWEPPAPVIPEEYPDSLTVSELRRRIDRLLRDGIRGNVWVRGVIASEVKHYAWASYFDLKDGEGDRDIYFRVEIKKAQREMVERKLARTGAATELARDLPVFVNVEVYLPLRNVMDIRLNVTDILPEYTQARLRSQRELTLEKLHEEGVLNNQKQLALPAVITRLGLITSEQGTSVTDILAGMQPYERKYNFYFVDSRMEGVNAVDSIIRGLDFFEHRLTEGESPEVIIIARGGGSDQSLSVFNDLRLCRRVCLSAIPVITAIGHEKDVTAIEQCSWLTPTPATPSGAGKYFRERYMALETQLADAIGFFWDRFNTIRNKAMQELSHHLKGIALRGAAILQMRAERVSGAAMRLEQAVSFTVRDQEHRLVLYTDQVNRNHHRVRRLNGENVLRLARVCLDRSRMLRERSGSDLDKTSHRLDLQRLCAGLRRKGESIQKTSQLLATLVRRNMDESGRELENLRRLISAHDPLNILKKGFTLTFDNQGRIIKSIHEFTGLPSAVLKFHDGSAAVAPLSASAENIPPEEET